MCGPIVANIWTEEMVLLVMLDLQLMGAKYLARF